MGFNDYLLSLGDYAGGLDIFLGVDKLFIYFID